MPIGPAPVGPMPTSPRPGSDDERPAIAEDVHARGACAHARAGARGRPDRRPRGHRPRPALASTPFWQAISEPAPSYLPTGGEGEIIVGVSDLGDAPASGASTPVSITDRLPAGLRATAITGSVRNGVEVKCPAGSPPPSLTCTFAGMLYPYERLTITVKVEDVLRRRRRAGKRSRRGRWPGPGRRASVPAVLRQRSSLRSAANRRRLACSPMSSPPLDRRRLPATQAGSHPFQLTTTLVTNQTAQREPVALPKDLSFVLPPGLIGNPTAVESCSEADFVALVLETNLCPPSSVDRRRRGGRLRTDQRHHHQDRSRVQPRSGQRRARALWLRGVTARFRS